eukprot:m.43245 g.43245  ORF g.43245 m.43245 type:complete len:553 (-) comp10751_c0_seq2:314-1972(-)
MPFPRSAAMVAMAFFVGLLTHSILHYTSENSVPPPFTRAAAEAGVQSLEQLQQTLAKLEDAIHERQQSRDDPVIPQIELVGIDGLVSELEALRGSLESIAQSAGAAGNSQAADEPPPESEVDEQQPLPPALEQVVTTTPAPKRNYIRNLGLVKCLDSSLSYKNNGVKLYPCNNGQTQSFWLSESFQLRHANGCADGSAGNSNIRLAKCAGSAAQKWELVDEGASTGPAGTRLRNSASKQCLDIDEEWAVVKPCSDACSQRWLISLIGSRADSNHLKSLSPSAPVKRHGIRVLCWILTQPRAHATMVVAINNTWGRECDHLLFASSQDFPGVNMMVVDTGQPESRKILWLKTQQAWIYIYQNYLDKADWFFKADDDTYALMPFLREYAASLDPAVPAHYGRRLQYGGQPGADNTFVSGGSGMLLSRAAVAEMGRRATEDPAIWAGPINGPADLLTSRTLHQIKIEALDTRDAQDRHRFITVGLEMEHTLFRAKQPEMWLWSYSNDTKEGHDCCSPRWLATHYVKEAEMYALYNMQQIQCRPNRLLFPYLDEQP